MASGGERDSVRLLVGFPVSPRFPPGIGIDTRARAGRVSRVGFARGGDDLHPEPVD